MYSKIDKLCRDNNIKPSQLCEKIGIPKSTLSELKSGRTKNPSTQTLQKIANYFDISLSYFDDSSDPVDDMRDSLYEKRKVLFDLSKRATEEQLDSFIVMFEALVDKES